MEQQQLLVAVHVYTLAREFRRSERVRYGEQLPRELSVEEHGAEIDAWDAKHPFRDYLKQAYQEYRATAKMVAEFESELSAAERDEALNSMTAAISAGLENSKF